MLYPSIRPNTANFAQRHTFVTIHRSYPNGWVTLDIEMGLLMNQRHKAVLNVVD